MVGELTWQKRLLGLWLPLAGFLVVALFPFTWMAATSLKTNAELYDPKAMPLTIKHPSLVHYIDLLRETNFLVWVANTMLVAAIATGISLLLGAMLAYPLARMRFRGGALLAITVAVTYLIPQTLLFVPMADLIGRMKLGNTLTAVMLTYPTLLVPFIAWLLMGYFKTVPKELEEQAMIDGASRWRAMTRIILPLCMPGFLS
ncbi:MAG: sugar ABC transporter permease, partial [Candidatus Rokuibacteriota bacterium]